MIHTLDHYVHRSMAHITDKFTTHEKLEEKVAYTGAFLPYWGNTVVFDLDGDTKKQLAALQETLYTAAGKMLSHRIDPDTFHMTLHDLFSAPGAFREDDPDLLRAQAGARTLLAQWQGQKPLQMQGTWTFNMLQTSIVLGLRPVGDSWDRLSKLYKSFEAVQPLERKLCPHITLAYFTPGIYPQEVWKNLEKALGSAPLNITLTFEALKLKNFTHMNHYEEVK